MNDEAKKMLDEILAKPVNILDENDKAILRARRSYLSKSQIEDYAEFLKDEEDKALSDYTKKELEKMCEEKGIEIPENVKNKADLVEFLEATPNEE